jgi:hypothetical protein
VNEDTAKKAAQKDAQQKARIQAEGAAVILLDEYYCTDDDCPDPEITISYSSGKAKCTDDTEKDPTGVMVNVHKCKVRCNWKVILECVDGG